ncbi:MULTISPECIES: hypothetical protein [unclassified Neisseria]|uniref:hypothetical protein n=1 Tax=unclassified Neisseria TaxID=2623750 RepID=UPI0026658735|nr:MULTISPECIES: hypothetical protein [unclassified Neisseria]MDO1509955.1 hypothetical protein [Neisseria sp. MVDL19-042950]MDO1516154.1 hypothetical protein [Neisseria sp. MVDL18-041461]MDO1563269.1 hypothetical protein [Neisseria sp. MVDL20-010259]
MDFEFGFKTLWGLATAAGWFWVNGISNRLKDAEKDRADLRKELHQVKLEYRSKKDAEADQKTMMDFLGRVENKLDKLADKIDRKADK